MPPSSETLRAVVRHYRLWQPDRDSEAEWWRAEDLSFADALRRAALARVKNGSKHGHQRRLENGVLNEAASILGSICNELNACQSFDQIFDHLTIALRKISGVGEMYIYDTADRIAQVRGPALAPDRIYLHRGTRAGAMALGFDLGAGDKTLRLDQLPTELQGLTAREAEDVLCIYKDVFTGKAPIPSDDQAGCGKARRRARVC